MRKHRSPEADAHVAQLFAQKIGQTRADLITRRRTWQEDALKLPLPQGTRIEQLTVAGIACERVSLTTTPDDAAIFLWAHGGGYVNGSPITHRKMAAELSELSGLVVLVPDYRLAPEAPFPAGLDDMMAVWRALSGQVAILGGDSAGGGMALAMMLRAREEGLTQPRGVVLLSPWTDILAEGQSYTANASLDPIIDAEYLREAGRQYTGGSNPRHPLISPLHADLSGLAAMLIQVGAHETMCSDSTAFAARAKAAGVLVDLEVWPGLWHVWQHETLTVPEAREAMAKVAAFIQAQLERV